MVHPRAHRLLGQAEIVRDIDSAHRQVDHPRRIPRRLLRPFEQHLEEARQPLRRGFAPEQHHLRLRGGKLVGGEPVELAFHCRMFGEEVVEAAAREPAQIDRPQRLCREGMLIVDADSQELAGEHEPHHLPPAIRQQLVELQHPFGDSEDPSGKVAFVEERLSRPQPHRPAEPAHLRELVAFEDCARRDRPHRAALADMTRRQWRDELLSWREHDGPLPRHVRHRTRWER